MQNMDLYHRTLKKKHFKSIRVCVQEGLLLLGKIAE